MNTKSLSNAEMANILFEIGLALRLKKISTKEVEKFFPPSKLNKIASKIEHEIDTWDNSHIAPGDRLKAALEIHEISQAELARRLKVNYQKINDLIKGRITLTIAWAKKIGDVLGVNYKSFI